MSYNEKYMKLNTKNSDAYSQEEILPYAVAGIEYLQFLQQVVDTQDYRTDESSINLPTDTNILDQVQQLATAKVSGSLRYIFVVGIGGSNLGTKAVYDALYGSYADWFSGDRPRMIFVDTNNEATLKFLIEVLIPALNSPDEYLLVTISKSGGTTETIANTEILLEKLSLKFGDAKSRTVVITDEDSAYWLASGELGVDRLPIPAKVGGRYSVFSAVGLFPLLVAGVDVVSFRQGATDMRADCLSLDPSSNPAIQSSALLAWAKSAGYVICDTFVFNSELESLGRWYRQLLGESIGKEFNLDGDLVNCGITPTVSVGSTDLHSVGQLYLGGPKDKITTFVHVNRRVGIEMPVERSFPTVLTTINKKSTVDIMQAILGGTKMAYNKKHMPFMEVELSNVSPYELGAFMQFKMMEMMLLGKILKVNPFDQPNVEAYKIETKKLLEA